MTQIRSEYPVADLGLAQRLELAEALGNVEFVEARVRAFRELGAEWIEVAGARAMYDGADSPCTQTFGLGMFQPLSSEDFERFENFYQERGAPVHHEVCPLADPSALALLNERGYKPMEFSNVLYQPLDGARVEPSADYGPIRVRRTGPGEEMLWARVAAEGWRDVMPELYDYLLEMCAVNTHRSDPHCFLAELEGEPIAAGAMGFFEGVALLAGACTIPKWRKRGAQQALLGYRLRYAANRGCELAMVVALPGSASQRNAERNGFRIAYTRTKWRLGAGS
jgi:GNAT superfamily N-acetyltransferase